MYTAVSRTNRSIIRRSSVRGKEARQAFAMDKKARAKQRREKRHQEISLLRSIPYSDDQRWWTPNTIAVVTGANRGIGYEIAHQLAVHGLTVILTSRDGSVGESAAKILQEGGLNVVFHQLDIVVPSSIIAFAEWIKEIYGGIDILEVDLKDELGSKTRSSSSSNPSFNSNFFNPKEAKALSQCLSCCGVASQMEMVNNAGVNFNTGSDNSVEFAEKVIATNYFGTKNMIKGMIPLMRPSDSGARIVNVSSRLGRLNGRRNRIGNVDLRKELEDIESLSEELIDKTMHTFLGQVKDGSWKDSKWPQVFTDYSLSKLAVNAYTRLMMRKLSERPDGQHIYINCCCPGWVKTSMTDWAGHTSPEEGADTAVWLALLKDHPSVNGKFFAERREINF